MPLAHEKLQGLDRDRVLGAVDPVLAAHRVEGVELTWRTDQGGRVLELTIERPDSRVPGAGITIELCSEISRDLSAALDVADAIPGSYRLQVGSPGLERSLYGAGDYARFAGQLVRLKLRDAVDGQRVLSGTLHGLDQDGCVLVETERGELALDPAGIESARLVFDWNAERARAGKSAGRKSSGNGHRPKRKRSR